MGISSLHHLTETNQMGHSLEGIDFYGLKQYGSEIRLLDVILAYSFFIYLTLHFGILNIISFIKKNSILLIFSLLLSFICDFLLYNRPNTYLILHLFWHIGIYFTIYKIVCIL